MEAVTVLGFLTNNVEDGIDKLSAFSVMSFGPVVTSTRLAEDEVIGAEDLTVRARSNAVHRSGLQIHENRAWDVPPAARFVVVDVNPVELEIGVSLVTPRLVDPVLGADHFPELGADLVPALASLDVKNLSHLRLNEIETLEMDRIEERDFEKG